MDEQFFFLQIEKRDFVGFLRFSNSNYLEEIILMELLYSGKKSHSLYMKVFCSIQKWNCLLAFVMIYEIGFSIQFQIYLKKKKSDNHLMETT